jgi:hypothetical protein
MIDGEFSPFEVVTEAVGIYFAFGKYGFNSLSLETGCPVWDALAIYLFPPGKCRDKIRNRPRPIPTTPYLIRKYPKISLVGVIIYGIFTTYLNKQKNK